MKKYQRRRNLRMQVRKMNRWLGRKMRTAPKITLLRRPHNTVVLRLSTSYWSSLGLRQGARIWLHVQGNVVHVTSHPWGPNPGRRYTARLRNCNDPVRREVRDERLPRRRDVGWKRARLDD